MSLYRELKRRNVLRVFAAYAVTAWLLIEVSATLEDTLRLPEWADTLLAFFLILGLPLVLFFSWAYEITPDGIRAEKNLDPGDSRRSDTGRRLNRIIVALMAVALVYFAFDKFVAFDPASRSEPAEQATMPPDAAPSVGRQASEGSASAARQLSVLVLPFVNMSGDPEQAYFSDGMSEELLNLLAKIPQLRVISRSTAFTFKGKDVVIPEVADRLEVTHVLEGSVRKAGNRLRVTAQLIEGATDTHLWSETYDRDLDDVFAIQDDISARVVEELKLHLLGERSQSIDPSAYEMFLRARHTLEAVDRDFVAQAESLLREVVAIEPEYLPAYFWLLDAIGYRADSDNIQDVNSAESEQRKIIERMVSIDPLDSYTNTAQGIFYMNDFQRAASHWERVIADDPYEPSQALIFIAFFLANLNRVDEADRLSTYLVDRDPACMYCIATLVAIYRKQGRHLEAARVLERLIEWREPLDYHLWQLGVAWLIAGDAQKALGYFDSIDPEVMGGNRRLGRAMALHDLGRMEDFEQLFSTMRDESETSPESVARVYAWMGETDHALEYLDKLVALEGSAAAHVATFDLYMKLWDDPRYQAFLARHGQAPEDLSAIAFDPDWPPELAAVVRPGE